MSKQGVILILMLLAMGAQGSEDSFWNAEVELGAVFTSGNTDEENLKIRGEVIYDGDRFKHTMHYDTLSSSKEQQISSLGIV